MPLKGRHLIKPVALHVQRHLCRVIQFENCALSIEVSCMPRAGHTWVDAAQSAIAAF